MTKGKVYLVGAGPGDPKLITVKGLESIKKADAIVYDRLASPRLLTYAKPGAEKIYAGKLPNLHTMDQDAINRLLVDLALEGKVVTRLKGGDPNIFGRVGEEASLLVDHGIEFEIVPGITSAIAAPAYAGIPITHRDFNSSFAVVTGHERPEKKDSTINWEEISTATKTILFLMGITKIRHIRDQLIKYGKSPQTPVALIRWGTRVEQKTLVGTLETIAEQVEQENFKPPAVILVGEVVKLREKLKWFENKPLFGKRVLVTRARAQASELADQIDDLGGEAVEFPVIELKQPEDEQTLNKLDQALQQLEQYHWVVFTSVNGVDYFFKRLRDLRIDIRTMQHARIAAVGPKTAGALEERGLVVTSIPKQFQGEGLLEGILPELEKNQNVLLPRADIAREYLPKKLNELGLNVTEVDVYENVISDHGLEEVLTYINKNRLNVITFTSSSTVRNLVDILTREGLDAKQYLNGVTIVCIGPITAQTAQEYGLNVTKVAEEATIESLIEAIKEI
ncbi:uroporphyrinogen-III C-methyltransferase [Chengkuizengella axinellae]|uniref:uroporphyrinogen-III C-methyltransferase n=1 Tax=Chengkuizengella axinellae TaxID=3064388 RepID=A0ABT9ITQ2_9BACL|nr:uroporphyrinogen-III C-methyltransferase [Chengkuizengella sp. 2205SS18-9]MDP5272697.1 uroporphyrinogen-III C-methyltransferase [Chengkuizengella sp. 2205SS18-9]